MAQLRAGTSWARLCISRAVLDRDGHTCRYRGQLADTLDHVIARMDGGRDDPNNPGGLLSRLQWRRWTSCRTFLIRGLTCPATSPNTFPTKGVASLVCKA
jgi:5-methylcytosine-specific restriction endonuclease McrA